MDVARISESLRRMYEEDGYRIVFWHDPEGEFEGVLGELGLDGVTVLRLDEEGGFGVKLRLEREDAAGRYLLYSPAEEPEYEQDWLLDIRLYSGSFRADRASLLLSELKLGTQSLREHLAARRKFFDRVERLRSLARLVSPDDTAVDLDRKMLAVVTGAEPAELFAIVRAVLCDWVDASSESVCDLEDEPAVWGQVVKLDLEGAFWSMVAEGFGYQDDSPTLRRLLVGLFVTDLSRQLGGDFPRALSQMVVPGSDNVVVFMAQWRDSGRWGGHYDVLSTEVSKSLEIEQVLDGRTLAELEGVMTFSDVERLVICHLRDLVMGDTAAVSEIGGVIRRRLDGHWCSQRARQDGLVPRRAFRAVYEALPAAAQLFSMRGEVEQFGRLSAGEMFAAYQKTWFRFDQLYRIFSVAANLVEAEGWEMLKPVRERVEGFYVRSYLQPLASAWDREVDDSSGEGLLSRWELSQSPPQHQFFLRHIQPKLKPDGSRRVFVLISDALRYEVGEELAARLNGRYRLEAKLSAQLGVLPSFTPLGMAALLPHRTLRLDEAGAVWADDQRAMSMEDRNQVLKGCQGMAISATELMQLSKEAGRERVKHSSVIYVFHNHIDATADHAATEGQTFEAVGRAVEELGKLVTFIVNNLNGNRLLITADHGFLFTVSSPTETERTKIEPEPAGVILSKKRFLLGRSLGRESRVLHGRTKITAGTRDEMEFWIPHGLNRFHFTGGARFVHGGATLQEVCIPLIEVEHKKNPGSRGDTRSTSVPVQVAGKHHKITTPTHRFKLIQTEAVSDRMRPVTMTVAVYDGGEPVTNVETVTMDSTSTDLDALTKVVMLTLKQGQYDKRRVYHLILRRTDDGKEIACEEVTIDRAISDEF